jgi:hypothetical protein
VAEPAAAQDDVREALVDLGRAAEPDGLHVEDDAEDRADHLVERRRRWQLDQREIESLRLLGHHRRDRADVARRLDRHSREAAVREARDQLVEGEAVVPERVRRRQQQLVLLDPVEDVGDFHDVDRPNHPVEPGRPRDEPGLRHGGQDEHVADRYAAEGAALRRDHRRRHDGDHGPLSLWWFANGSARGVWHSSNDSNGYGP